MTQFHNTNIIMKLQMSHTLLAILSYNIGKKAAHGYVVEKLLVAPSDPDRQTEYLKLYMGRHELVLVIGLKNRFISVKSC